MIVIRNGLEIRHSLNNRIRCKVYPMRFNEEKAARLYQKCHEIKGIIRVRINPRCASLIIRYNPDMITRAELIETIKKFLIQQETSVNHRKSLTRTRSGKNTLKYAIIRFVSMTALTILVFVKEVILKQSLAQSLFSPLGIITTIAALPLLKKGLENIKEKRFTLESFLGGSIVTAVAAGEATAALEILWITSGAELLKTWITERSRQDIRNILQVTEKNTYILVRGVEVEVPVRDVNEGDTLAIHTGEKISVDGFITDGQALLDESSINGRTEFVLRQSGDKVFAGTFVREGVIHVHAEKVGDNTYLARILQMVEDSLENKAPIEGVAEKLASNLIRIGFVTTLSTLVITRSLWRAFTVMLVMACPCATILAASTAISAALNAAAKRHILIKGGRYLEDAGKADIICFDKTGTLTTNEPELVRLINFSDMPDNELLQIAYSAEKHNSHPVATAVKTEAEKLGIEAIPHDLCNYTLGRGVRAKIQGEEFLVGSSKFMETCSVDTDEARRILRKFRMQGLTTVFIAGNRKLLGVMGFANQNRPDIHKVIRHLRNNGIKKVVMITGDERYTALELTRQLDMEACYYSVMPEDKSDIVNELKGKGHKILMVGDGINDALALAEADIGVAMGAGGSEVAIEAADIALVKDDLKGILYVRALSQATIRTVHQNFWIATGSNIAGVILGAMGILSPVMAGLIHIVHTLGVLANSSRLLFYEPSLLPNGEFAGVLEYKASSSESNILNFEDIKKISCS